ncbi:MAG: hypothetical protein M1546_20465 [Chloroflexi bacterium]|nr:hypothetical protein [Chloroflexota bacterium]
MWHQFRNGKRTVFSLLGVAVLLAGGCSAGVSQAEYDKAKQDLADQEQKAAAYQKELSDKVQEVENLKQQQADLQKQGGGPAGVTVLMGAKVVTPAPPAPTPTAPPADYTPPPRPVPPASYDEPVAFSLYVETLQTTRPSSYNVASTVSCVPGSVFKRGQRIVWRFEVIDISTGKRLTDKDEPTIKLQFPNGDEATARFSQRAGGRVPDAPWMWNATWDIPTDFPLGGLDYGIVITAKDGRTMTWKQPALVSQTSDSRVQVVE